jgi:hypothetical protein
LLSEFVSIHGGEDFASVEDAIEVAIDEHSPARQAGFAGVIGVVAVEVVVDLSRDIPDEQQATFEQFCFPLALRSPTPKCPQSCGFAELTANGLKNCCERLRHGVEPVGKEGCRISKNFRRGGWLRCE